ncbi:MAG: alpha/beta hydrolase [Desulfobacterales bacterium]|nr:MAG: alpha/beta hydrolase [Desulfobacterales bacterium]
MKPKLVVAAIFGLILSIALIYREDSAGGLTPKDEKSFSNSPASSAFSKTAVDEYVEEQSEDHSTRWFYSDAPGKLKGVALVIHGLNLRPEKMQTIISRLTEADMDVLGLSLRGHGENYTHSNGIGEDQARLEAFKNVSYQLWMNEAYLAYLQLKARGEKKGVPLFLTAFSLGGLVGLELFASNPDVRFDKTVLFAPAIRLHATIYLERVLSPFPRLVIPSMAPKTYLANKKGTPIAAYNALFEGLDRFNKNSNQKLNVPTLVFIDEQDEFIPLGKLRKLVEEKKWNQWQFYMVAKDQSAQDERFYHHIIDASSTGNAVWQDMMKAAVNHLLNNKSQ